MGCGMSNVGFPMCNVECEMWNVGRGMLECWNVGMWHVACGMWGAECAM